jgi:hypothetical protein
MQVTEVDIEVDLDDSWFVTNHLNEAARKRTKTPTTFLSR